MTSFYLIRHGQKEAIPFDPPLTTVGVKQAEHTAEFLKNVSFKAVFASPKARTRQTAEIIARPHSLPISTDERLMERLEWENDQTFDEFISEWNKTDLDRSYFPKKGIASMDNGERIKHLIDELSVEYNDGNILIVSHGGTIGDLLRNLFLNETIHHKTEPKSGAPYIDILECGITTIRKNNNAYELLQIGDISHLPTQLV